jgi:hypothetical protein
MKTIKILLMTIALSMLNQYASAQCSGNKIRIVRGSYRCGCHCQKKCISPADLAAYQASGWYQGTDCFGSCCWVRLGEETDHADAESVTMFTQIYPNPASGSVTIEFSLAEPSSVTFELYDVIGRYVTTIANDLFEGGSSEEIWDSGSINPGIYFLRMNAAGYTGLKRISVIR